MSKRALKNYLNELTKQQLEDQIMDLYQRFKEVKTYYDFTFNPREEKLLAEAKFRITNEYFPQRRRKPKARRSVAQKYLKHFIQIGVDAPLVAELMLYNIEVAQAFNAKKPQKADAFFKSIATSFEKAVDFIRLNGLEPAFSKQIRDILDETEAQNWYNLEAFERKLEDR